MKRGAAIPLAIEDQKPHRRQRNDRPAPLGEFIAWDGEGITYPGDVTQSYVLFGASTGDRVVAHSLGSEQCFDLLLRVEQENPDAIHVGFALHYDTNMMLRDLPRWHLFKIYRQGWCFWRKYRLEYRPGKWLRVKDTDNGTTICLYDVWGFFQSSFVTACERFLDKDDPELEKIRDGKAARSSFTFAQLQTYIIPYWQAELRLLVRVMDSLRDDLLTASLPIKSWHGPGAVANTTFRRFNVQRAKAVTPEEVRRASQFAYAGGRFEQFRCGHYPSDVWEYDINSAYPAAIATLPNLSTGTWERVSDFEPGSFGVWRVQFDSALSPAALFTRPQPLFYRDKHGRVSFPPFTVGWYWTPEAEHVKDYVQYGWVLRHDGTRPFDFVREMYATRREWKRDGNSAEKALKLALNSLYGKMAQRTGWKEGQNPPQWHQLEWAGYVTSSTRAMLYDAIQLADNSVVAVETDAIFTTQPLSLPIGNDLGEWEESRFDWLTYVQSGMYYAGSVSGIVEKYRGFDKGSVPHDRVMDYLARLDQQEDCVPSLEGPTTRFVGLGIGLFTRATWRSWETSNRVVEFGGGGKRSHVPQLCPQCRKGNGFRSSLHTCAITTAGGSSQAHKLPWESHIADEERLAAW